MKLFEWGPPAEKRTQLYFRDDGGFLFRKLLVEDTFLVEKTKNDEANKAWMMRYKLLKRFDGFKNIGADMVTISYARDIVFDAFSQLAQNEKLEKGKHIVKDFVKKIAEAKCYQHERSAKGSLFAEKIMMYLGICIVVLALSFGLKVSF